MGQDTTTGKLEIAGFAPQAPSKCFDDDGRLKRRGTVWTASAHIITAVIGSGVLSLAWATAQLGWVAGPTVLFLFSFVTYYTSCLLAACYRCGDQVNGKRNYNYMEAVQNNLGGFQVKICGFIQYFNLVGVAIGYTIAASISAIAIKRSSCFHEKGHDNPCGVSGTPYMLMFGVVEILFSQIPDFDQISWLSMLAAVMSFTYSSIGLGLGVSKVIENKKIKGSLTGISIGKDTLKSPPAEHKTMKRATLISVVTTTIFYMFCGCFGYAAFGDMAPGNLLTGFGFYNPYWLLDIANAAIVIHLVGAYQVYCQPLFAFVETLLLDTSLKAISSTTISRFQSHLAAFGFWPLTVYFPVEMYIVQKKIPKWSTRWVSLQILSAACLIISICAAAGSFAGVVIDLKVYKPFKTMY
ncbi:Amino acid transporter, transmembrane [Artemisia annua]|uniref:Amino acid transporter, transmembrane n=1 Tax=Artemisia annua TaxID=35608 RepID=A0A2U1P7F9_ARTAN|nr:Amino acid transporter, transmembrane [Artemisia annua]